MRRPSSSAARLADVARRAKVSLNTASRALTGKPDVNPETRERVRRVAEELDYRPNFLARSLVGGRTHIVGLVVTDCTDPFYAALIRAVEATATRRGYALLLATSNEDSAKEKQALAVLRERRVDGLLLTAVDAEAPHVRQLTRTDLPIVLVARRAASYRGHYVGNDNIEAATMATRHLIELGHQRMAYIDRTGTASSAVERMVGYRKE